MDLYSFCSSQWLSPTFPYRETFQVPSTVPHQRSNSIFQFDSCERRAQRYLWQICSRVESMLVLLHKRAAIVATRYMQWYINRFDIYNLFVSHLFSPSYNGWISFALLDLRVQKPSVLISEGVVHTSECGNLKPKKAARRAPKEPE